jgi:hypothetical protein
LQTNELQIIGTDVIELEPAERKNRRPESDCPEFWAMTAYLDKLSQGGQVSIEDYAEISRRVRIFLHQQGT